MAALALDEFNGFLYWGDESTIKRAPLKGDNITVIIDIGQTLDSRPPGDCMVCPENKSTHRYNNMYTTF